MKKLTIAALALTAIMSSAAIAPAFAATQDKPAAAGMKQTHKKKMKKASVAKPAKPAKPATAS